MIKLQPYQIKCADKMKNFKHCIVQMGTGTGKTYTTLSVSYGNIVVICTNEESKEQWVNSIDTMGLVANVYTYYQITQGKYDVLNFKQCNTLIVDECHNFTKGTSNRTKALAKIAKLTKAEYRYALSATPVRNHEVDYFTILKTINMDVPLTQHFKSATALQQWCYTWGNAYNHFMGRVTNQPLEFKEECRPELVRQSNIVFYEFKDRFKVYNYPILLTKPNMDIYKRAEVHGVLDGYHRTFGAGSKVIVLHQLANSIFKYNKNHTQVMDNDYLEKIKHIIEITRRHKKVVVVYNFTADAKVITAYKYYYDVYTDVDEFADAEHGVLLRQAGKSASKDIPHANAMVWYSMNYSGVDFAQMHGRTSRLNSKFNDLYYYYLIWDNTIEHLIYDVATGKMTKNQLESLFK